MNRLLLSISLSVFCLILASCDAEHSNPVDPSNPNYRYGIIDGNVTSTASEKLEGVKVLWKNQNILVVTDKEGAFRIEDVVRNNGLIIFEKDGFIKDTAFVVWGNQRNITLVSPPLEYAIGQIYGNVFYPPPSGKGLQGVKVLWKNQNILATTDTAGHYLLEGITRSNGWIYFEKEGFANDSVWVVWGSERNKQLDSRSLKFTIGHLSGYVSSYPHIRTKGVKVTWKNQNVSAITDAEGKYKIPNIQTEDGDLYFEKEGLKSVDIHVEWSGQESIDIGETVLKYNIGRLKGRVYYPSSDPASGVRVFWKNQNIFTTTDFDGYYEIKNLPMDNGYVYFEKEGLKKDSTFIRWNDENDSINADKTLRYTAGKLRGTVTNAAGDAPLSQVKVLWKNQNRIAYTNADGEYTFENVPYVSGHLVFEKDGYYKDSALVSFNDVQDEKVQDRRLTFIPVLQNASITTSVTYDFTGQTFALTIQVEIDDPDRKISLGQVYAKCGALNFNQRLGYNTQTDSYELVNFNFGQKNISEGTGQDFIITGIGSNGIEFTIGTSRFIRVIDKEITVRSPLGSQVVDPQPVLNWDRFLPGFTFKFQIDIYDETTIPASHSWWNYDISQDNIAITPDIPLSPGSYFWFMTCVDQYGNKSISKKYRFTVQ